MENDSTMSLMSSICMEGGKADIRDLNCQGRNESIHEDTDQESDKQGGAGHGKKKEAH